VAWDAGRYAQASNPSASNLFPSSNRLGVARVAVGGEKQMPRILLALSILATPLAAQAQFTSHLDIPYDQIEGVDPNLLSLDVFTPIADGPHPVMVMVHGGGWVFGDKTFHAPTDIKCVFFTTQGYLFVSINYRLAPAAQHPAQIQDVTKALAWVHDHIADYGGDPDRIYLMGHSAGAHLAALAVTDESYLAAQGKSLSIIRGAILLDGGYDLPLGYRTSIWLFKRLLVDAFTRDAAVRRDASPIGHVGADKGIPPLIVFHLGGRPLSTLQANRFADALATAGVEVTIVPVYGVSHCALECNIGTPGDMPTQRIMEFLASTAESQTASSPDNQ